MSTLRILAAGVAAAGFLMAAAPAQAAGGSAVVIDLQKVYAESLAGKDAQAKLKGIADNVTKELQPEGAALQSEQQQLGPKFQNKTQQQIIDDLKKDPALQTKYNSFIERLDAFQQKRALRQQELAATQQKAISDVLNAAQPDVDAAMNAKGAQIVFEREGIVAASPTIDITADVMTRFNGRVKSVAVTKVDLTKKQ
ncbi:MAG: OmpH family outer membrane protein [Hyphomonadaceae bacterium]